MEKGSVARTVSFASKLTQSPVISRGEDGKLLFTTEDLLYILDFDINIKKKHSELLVLTTEIPLPAKQTVFDVDIKFEDLKKQCTPDQWNTLVLKRLVPSLQLPGDGWTQKGFRTAALSPITKDCSNRALLATLTFDGNLRLLWKGRKKHHWNEVASLSDLWHTHVTEDNFSLLGDYQKEKSEKGKIYDRYVTRLSCLSSVALAWSWVCEPQVNTGSKKAKLEGKDNGKFAVLASAMKSGHVVLWRVPVPYVPTSQICILKVVDTEMGYPSKMCFCNLDSRIVLCVGFRNGCVRSFVFDRVGEDCLTVTSSPVWADCDLIAVSDMVWCDEEDTIVFSKGPHLVFAKLTDSKGSVQVGIKHTNIGHTNTISGLWYSNKLLYISLSDCSIYTAKIDKKSVHTGPVCERLSQPTHPGAWQSHGLCTSLNDAFLLAVQSPSVYYDHLSLKEPVQIKITYNKSIDVVASTLLQNDGTIRLSEYSDYQMCLTCAQIQGQPWPQVLEQLFGSASNIDSLPLHSLKLLRTLYQRKLTYMGGLTVKGKLDYNESEQELITSSVKSLTKEIIKRHLTQFISLWSQCAGPSDMDKLRLSLAKKFFLQTPPVPQVVKDNPVFVRAKDIPEMCIICNTALTYSNEREESCANGHTFARCCQTLVLCQKPGYRVCSVCSSLALSTEEMGSSLLDPANLGECTFCDGELL